MYSDTAFYFTIPSSSPPSPTRWFIINLHNVTSQKTFFMVTAVETSDPTKMQKLPRYDNVIT
jgi:hypothetical protein